jgi:hypothetical protein
MLVSYQHGYINKESEKNDLIDGYKEIVAEEDPLIISIESKTTKSKP